jgi:hypothetical protein
LRRACANEKHNTTAKLLQPTNQNERSQQCPMAFNVYPSFVGKATVVCTIGCSAVNQTF